jgi:transposase
MGLRTDAGQHGRLRCGRKLRDLITGITELVADKDMTPMRFRTFLKDRRIKTVIPGKFNRKQRIRYDKEAYKDRNVVERCFCRLKDWRRIATRYDKLARKLSLRVMLRRYAGVLALI